MSIPVIISIVMVMSMFTHLSEVFWTLFSLFARTSRRRYSSTVGNTLLRYLQKDSSQSSAADAAHSKEERLDLIVRVLEYRVRWRQKATLASSWEKNGVSENCGTSYFPRSEDCPCRECRGPRLRCPASAWGSQRTLPGS